MGTVDMKNHVNIGSVCKKYFFIFGSFMFFLSVIGK